MVSSPGGGGRSPGTSLRLSADAGQGVASTRRPAPGSAVVASGAAVEQAGEREEERHGAERRDGQGERGAGLERDPALDDLRAQHRVGRDDEQADRGGGEDESVEDGADADPRAGGGGGEEGGGGGPPLERGGAGGGGALRGPSAAGAADLA
ncbi:hypothetical protein C5C10_17320, partial [Rathayibacter sp. AY1A3]